MGRTERRRANRSEQRRNSVVLGYPYGDKDMEPAWHNCLRAMDYWDRAHGQHIVDDIAVGSGPMVAEARNEIFDAFRCHPHKPEWLLCIDTDMTFAPSALDEMLAVAHPLTCPILGGLCFIGGRSGAKVEPTIRVLTSKDPIQFETVWNYPENTVVECDNTGAAFMLVHRRVIEDLHEEWGDTAHTYFVNGQAGDRVIGEDVAFCLRAKARGYPIQVHTGIKTGHMKPGWYGDEETYLTYRRGITEMGEDGWRQHQYARRFLMNVKPT